MLDGFLAFGGEQSRANVSKPDVGGLRPAGGGVDFHGFHGFPRISWISMQSMDFRGF